MGTEQRTWSQHILGKWDESCQVRGRDIVCHLGGNRYKVLWTFVDAQDAQAAYRAWKDGF